MIKAKIMDSTGNMEVSMMDPAASRILGITADECQDLIEKDERDRAFKLLKRSFNIPKLFRIHSKQKEYQNKQQIEYTI